MLPGNSVGFYYDQGTGRVMVNGADLDLTGEGINAIISENSAGLVISPAIIEAMGSYILSAASVLSNAQRSALTGLYVKGHQSYPLGAGLSIWRYNDG